MSRLQVRYIRMTKMLTHHHARNKNERNQSRVHGTKNTIAKFFSHHRFAKVVRNCKNQLDQSSSKEEKKNSLSLFPHFSSSSLSSLFFLCGHKHEFFLLFTREVREREREREKERLREEEVFFDSFYLYTRRKGRRRWKFVNDSSFLTDR